MAGLYTEADYEKVNWLVKGIKEDITGINAGKTLTLSSTYALNNVTLGDVMALLERVAPDATMVEDKRQNGTFILPSAKTIHDLLEDYMSIYGVNTWAMSTYEAKRGLIFNYIDPLIGDMSLDEVTPRVMEKYYQSLLRVKPKVVNNKRPKAFQEFFLQQQATSKTAT